jgi:hypothetical protein
MCKKYLMYHQFDLYKINVLNFFGVGFQWMNIREKKCHYRLVHPQEKINNNNFIKHEFTTRINQYYKLDIKNLGSNLWDIYNWFHGYDPFPNYCSFIYQIMY